MYRAIAVQNPCLAGHTRRNSIPLINRRARFIEDSLSFSLAFARVQNGTRRNCHLDIRISYNAPAETVRNQRNEDLHRFSLVVIDRARFIFTRRDAKNFRPSRNNGQYRVARYTIPCSFLLISFFFLLCVFFFHHRNTATTSYRRGNSPCVIRPTSGWLSRRRQTIKLLRTDGY